uniref:Uncharacterized protein n=1 Tax=Picea glauca TaxID=3330 RepID=A0A117NIQ6_PICGL|nr:hypothetical protein ABT39_MTgene186 [Picea glauca]QHR89323.1 hypothetical protein Q903MT_gene3344 [Picea sitchensis]
MRVGRKTGFFRYMDQSGWQGFYCHSLNARTPSSIYMGWHLAWVSACMHSNSRLMERTLLK